MWYALGMAIPKENVVDLRKPGHKEKEPLKYEPDNFKIKPGARITVLAICGVILAGLVAYFLVSKNYLASLLFTLAGVTLAISVLFNKKRGIETPSKIKRSEAESLMDIFVKILGL